MKACKIDISQKWIDIEHPVYREVVRDSIMAKILETGKVPDVTESVYKEVTYYPVEVYEPGSIEVTTYLVKQDEEKIFRDLMTVQRDTVNSAIQKAVEKRWELEYYHIRSSVLKEIKQLPWYKRMFNKF
jgi:hypothetical protein